MPITLVVGRIALHGLRTLTQQQLVGPNTTSTVAIRNVRFTSTCDVESVATTFRFGSIPDPPTCPRRAAASPFRAARRAGAAVQGPGGIRRTRLRRACYTPRLAKGEAVREVAKADLRAEFRRQPSETIGSAPRADAAGNPDDDERVVGEALLPVKTSVRLRFP